MINEETPIKKLAKVEKQLKEKEEEIRLLRAALKSIKASGDLPHF